MALLESLGAGFVLVGGSEHHNSFGEGIIFWVVDQVTDVRETSTDEKRWLAHELFGVLANFFGQLLVAAEAEVGGF